MNRIVKYFSFAALSVLVLAGCYPGGPDYTSDRDVVYTNYNDTFNFKAFTTYAMPDQIVTDVQITNDGDTVFEYMDAKYADQLLDKISANMTANGWTQVPVEDNPDLLLMPAAFSTTSYYYSYWYGWWWGGYYPGWGWYYPPYWSVSSYTTGSMVMVLTDPNADSPINRTPTEWIGVANGVLTSGGNISRALSSIDQAFTQSPYLKIN